MHTVSRKSRRSGLSRRAVPPTGRVRANLRLYPGLLFSLSIGFFLAARLCYGADSNSAGAWQALFNGEDLNGWVSVNDGQFAVTNSNIHLSKGMGWLRTERPYTNFIFEAEWRALQTNYNSGFFLRAGLEGKPFPVEVWQVNLKETALASLLKGSKTIVPSITLKLPVNEWCKFRMEVSGRKLVLYVNGERAWEFSELDSPHGYIGLQAEGKSFDFRNLHLQELP
jgi:hypothetical protein